MTPSADKRTSGNPAAQAQINLTVKQQREQQQQAKLDVDEQELKKEIANQKAPGNLTANARRLGLVESEDPAYIRLPDGQTIGVPHPAQGAPSVTSQQGNGG